CAAGRHQVGLAAPARLVRRIPGHVELRRRRIALAIGVAEHGLAELAAGPVVAGQVEVARKRLTLHVGAGQDVVMIGLLAAYLDAMAILAEDRLLVDLVVGAVQVGNAGGDDHALGVLPRPIADAVARVDGRAGVCRVGGAAKIGAPSLAARPGRLRQLLAMSVGAFEPAEIAALTGTGTGDKEAHVAGLWALHAAGKAEGHERGRRKDRKVRRSFHWRPPFW